MSSYRILFSADAKSDREMIYRYTREQFGLGQALRYEGYLNGAILSLSRNPKRIGSKSRPEIAPGVRSLRLAIAGTASGQQRARHIILYFEPNADSVVIIRILHESMELRRHLRDLETPDESLP